MKMTFKDWIKRWWVHAIYIAGLYVLFLFQNLRLCENYHGKYGPAGVIWSDAYCYYVYLPGTFIKEKPLQLKYGLKGKDGALVNKVTYGVALMQAPFFFSNYQIQTWRGFSGTGFEKSYGKAILVATSTYVFIGLWMVFSLLKSWFNYFTAAVSVLAVFYGTNMFHYVYAEPGMAHAYSFFCVAGILFFTDRFYKNPKFGLHLILVAAFVALAVIVRPVNVFVILIFALYGCHTWGDIKDRFRLLFTRAWLIPTFAVIGFLFLLPQMYYWYLTAGKWILFSYGLNHEKFEYWTNPKIMEALFHQQGGWFPYAQIMVVSAITIPFMIYKKKFHGWMIVIVFASVLYVCSSWWAINFMCAHGYRSFIDYYPIFIIPFAYALYSVTQLNVKWLKIAYTTVMMVLIYFACCMNLDFTTFERCNDKNFTFYDYIKLYDNYF